MTITVTVSHNLINNQAPQTQTTATSPRRLLPGRRNTAVETSQLKFVHYRQEEEEENISFAYSNIVKLEVHLVERIYLRQRCLDASKPRVVASTGSQYQYVGFSRRNKIPRCSAYAMEESNPVPASRL